MISNEFIMQMANAIANGYQDMLTTREAQAQKEAELMGTYKGQPTLQEKQRAGLYGQYVPDPTKMQATGIPILDMARLNQAYLGQGGQKILGVEYPTKKPAGIPSWITKDYQIVPQGTPNAKTLSSYIPKTTYPDAEFMYAIPRPQKTQGTEKPFKFTTQQQNDITKVANLRLMMERIKPKLSLLPQAQEGWEAEAKTRAMELRRKPESARAIATLNSLNMWLTTMARVAGEVGVITQQDIERTAGNIVKIKYGSTPEKEAALNEIFGILDDKSTAIKQGATEAYQYEKGMSGKQAPGQVRQNSSSTQKATNKVKNIVDPLGVR